MGLHPIERTLGAKGLTACVRRTVPTEWNTLCSAPPRDQIGNPNSGAVFTTVWVPMGSEWRTSSESEEGEVDCDVCRGVRIPKG